MLLWRGHTFLFGVYYKQTGIKKRPTGKGVEREREKKETVSLFVRLELTTVLEVDFVCRARQGELKTAY